MAGEMIVSFEGTTGREPELGQTHSGKSALSVSVAVTPRVQKGDDWVERATSWVEARMYGAVADNAAASLPKGTRVVVTGRLYEDEFTRKDGSAGRKLVCDVESIGPALRFATATVMPRSRGTSPQQQGQSWAGQQQGQSWSQQQSQGDAWAQPGNDSGYGDEGTPF